MKHFLKAAALVIAVSAFSITSSVAQGLKIRKMDTAKVLKEYWRMKELAAELKKEEENIQKENKDKQEDIQKLNDKILELHKQLQDKQLLRNEREKLTIQYKKNFDLLNNTKRRHQDYIQGKIRAINVQRQKKQAEMFKEIRNVVNEYATKNGLDAVLEQSNVMFMKDTFDITEEIIKLVNEGREDSSSDESGKTGN